MAILLILFPLFSAEAASHEPVHHQNRTRRQVQNVWSLLGL